MMMALTVEKVAMIGDVNGDDTGGSDDMRAMVSDIP